MLELLRDPAWQGAGAILSLFVGLMGFFLTNRSRTWLLVSGALLAVIVGVAVGASLPPAAGQAAPSDRKPLKVAAKHAHSYTIPQSAPSNRLFGSYLPLMFAGAPDSHHLQYLFASADAGYTVGMNLPLTETTSFAGYKLLTMHWAASHRAVVDLIVHDASDRQFIRSHIGTGEPGVISIPIAEIERHIDVKAIRGFYVTGKVVDQASSGSHAVVLHDIALVR